MCPKWCITYAFYRKDLDINWIKDVTQKPVLCLCLCSCVGFHWGPALRVRRGFHLARSSGQCHLWRPVPVGHRDSKALHRPSSGWHCAQWRRPVCLPWCHWKGKPDEAGEAARKAGAKALQNPLRVVFSVKIKPQALDYKLGSKKSQTVFFKLWLDNYVTVEPGLCVCRFEY